MICMWIMKEVCDKYLKACDGHLKGMRSTFLIFNIVHYAKNVAKHKIIGRKSVNFRQNVNLPVRIRVRIDPPHPLVCRKRRLNGAVLRMRPEKPRLRVEAGVAR
jgi:hypothetical protein